MGKVMIIIGSDSDRGKMEESAWLLVDNKIDVEVHIVSAHRTPEALRALIMESDADVFIAGAGMAAALPGAVAALTPRPVIGVPLSGSALNGVEALFSIAQMPRGVPVATVAIDGAENAAILALEILGIKEQPAEDAVYRLREEMRTKVTEKNRVYEEYFKTQKFARREG